MRIAVCGDCMEDVLSLERHLGGRRSVSIPTGKAFWRTCAVICFVSTSDGFYREAYDLYAVQYLIKPVREEAP